MNSRKFQVASGVIFASLERFSAQGIRLVISIILARLLSPEHFGVFGILTIFLALAQVIQDSGFSSALIQKKDLTQSDKSSIFYVNLALGILVTGILFSSGGIIADFFDQPILKNLTRAISFVILINSFGLVQTAVLTKSLSFKTLLLINLVAGIISGIIGILLAYFGYGIWSLAIQSLISSLITVILLWVNSPWVPGIQFDIRSVKKLFTFGSRLLLSGILDTIFRNIYKAFIGRAYSARELGFYSNPKTALDSILGITSGSLSRVLYPAFSPIQDEESHLKNLFQKAIGLSAFLHFPLMVGLAAIAEPLIISILTSKWSGSIQILQLICFANFLYPLNVINLDMLKVKSRSDLFLRFEVFKKVLIIISILMTFKFGIVTLLYGQIATSTLALFINSSYSSKLINYGIFAQLKDNFPSLITSIGMGAFLVLLQLILQENNLITVFLLIVFALCFYLISNFLIKNFAIYEFRNLVLSFVRSISKREKS